MKLSQTLVAAIVVALGSVGLAQAQHYPMPIVPMPGPSITVPDGRIYPGGIRNTRSITHPITYPGYNRISHPVYITPERFNGYTPWGGINTRNHQVNNTYFDYGRNGSQYNGTRRWINRPVYDTYGRVTGYQQGHVWNNSITGQEHGNVNTVTPNGHGGDLVTSTQYSTAGGNIKPMNAGK